MRRPIGSEFTPLQRTIAKGLVVGICVVGGSGLVEACSSSSTSSTVAASTAPATPNHTPASGTATSPAPETHSTTTTPETGYAAFQQAQAKIGHFGRLCTEVTAVSTTTTRDSFGNPVTARNYTFNGQDLTCTTTEAPTATSMASLEQVTVTMPDGEAFQLASSLDSSGNVSAVYATKIQNAQDGQTQTFVELTAAGAGDVMIARPGKQPVLYGGDSTQFVGDVYAELERLLPTEDTTAFTSPADLALAYA